MDDQNAPRRRVIIRRSRGFGGSGFSGGSLTTSESLREPSDQEPDEVDDAVDLNTISNSIRQGSAAPPPMDVDPNERDNPRSRLNAVAIAGSANYAKEYRLGLLHRLLMRNVPLDQIARQLNVSISTVEKDRAELKKRLREAALQLNIDEMVGNNNALYDEISGMSLRIASQASSGRDEHGNPTPPVPIAMRLAAMRTALASNADRTRFLNSAGVFDALRFRRGEDGETMSDVQTLMQQTLELMNNLDTLDAPATPPAPRPGGFAPMTFDDIDASGSANEIQEL